MTRTLLLEGDVNAADTRVVLTAQGSVTAPSLVVPSGMTKIKKIYSSVGVDFAAAGSANWILRLGGNGVLGGEQTMITGGAGGQAVQAGSDAAGSNAWLYKLDDADIDVRPSDTLTISSEMAGSDLGDSSHSVTVVFGR